jgi:hypothetical protein
MCRRRVYACGIDERSVLNGIAGSVLERFDSTR